MRWRKPTPWSLDQPSDLVPLAVGSAVGIGNFYVIPSLVLGKGGLIMVAVHLLGLFFLGSSLLLAEFLWSRWLLRPYLESFAAVSRNLAFVPLLTYLAVALILPSYIVELGRLLLLTMISIRESGFVPSGARAHIESNFFLSYIGAFVVLAISCALTLRAPSRTARLMKLLVATSFSCWTFVAFKILSGWGNTGLSQILEWDSDHVNFDSVFRTLGFSLFTLSAGMGVMYTFTYYASQAPLSSETRSLPFWKRSGTLIRAVRWVVLGDFLSSLLCLVIVSPFAQSLSALQMAGESKNVDSLLLILDWVPQILVHTRLASTFSANVFLIGLLAAGFASAISLLDLMAFTLERELRWSRRRAVGHVFVLGLLMILLPLAPYMGRLLSWVGADLLLPVSAIFLCFAVGWKMPFRAQQSIWGRGLLLDPLHRIWRLSVRYLVPGFLLIYLVRQILG